jgi:hypothetical protein
MIVTAEASPQTFFIDTLTATPSNDNYYALTINGNTGGPNNTPQTYTPSPRLLGGAQVGLITFLLRDFSMTMDNDSAEVEFVRAGCLVLTEPSVSST